MNSFSSYMFSSFLSIHKNKFRNQWQLHNLYVEFKPVVWKITLDTCKDPSKWGWYFKILDLDVANSEFLKNYLFSFSR